MVLTNSFLLPTPERDHHRAALIGNDDVTERAWNTMLEPRPAIICKLPSQFKPKLNLLLTELRTAVELSHNSPLMVSAFAHANTILREPGRSEQALSATDDAVEGTICLVHYIAIAYLGTRKKRGIEDLAREGVC